MDSGAPGTNEVVFFKTKEKWGEFSNFSQHSFEDEHGRIWKTSEHYYQAHKTLVESQFDEILNAKTAWESANLGRSPALQLRSDWDSVKLDVMRRALKLKFTQNKECFLALMESRDSVIVELSYNDQYWGRTPDGFGENWLGKLLMELRHEFYSRALRNQYE